MAYVKYGQRADAPYPSNRAACIYREVMFGFTFTGKFHGCFYGWLTERRMLTQSDGSARDAASFNISRRDRIFMAVVPYNDVI